MGVTGTILETVGKATKKIPIEIVGEGLSIGAEFNNLKQQQDKW